MQNGPPVGSDEGTSTDLTVVIDTMNHAYIEMVFNDSLTTAHNIQVYAYTEKVLSGTLDPGASPAFPWVLQETKTSLANITPATSPAVHRLYAIRLITAGGGLVKLRVSACDSPI